MADKVLYLFRSDAEGGPIPLKLHERSDGTCEFYAANLPASGQAAMASSIPVVLASDQFILPTTFKTQKATNIGSIATVWTPATGKKIRLLGGTFSVSAAVSVLFEDNAAGTDVFQTPVLVANTSYTFDLGKGVLLSAINRVLKATASAAATMTGTLYGTEE